MALTEYTIKITNTKSNPTVLGNPVLDLVIISPTGITTPQTPYDSYISDMLTVTPGTISVPLYKREQFFNLPAASVLTITTDDGQEALYYENMELEGAVVTVTSSPVQVVLALDKSAVSVTAASGDAHTASLTASSAGASSVTWASSDTSIATVSSGTVTGVAAGTATITATTTYDGATFTATATVTVS